MALPTELFNPRQLTTNPVELITYEVDAGFDRGKPDGAFFPESNEDVSRLVRWAGETGTPLKRSLSSASTRRSTGTLRMCGTASAMDI